MKGQVKTKAITVGVFLTLILGGGLFYTITAEDLQNAYICKTTNVTSIFERLSSTGITGYYAVNGVTEGAVCEPNWTPLTVWCEENKIDCNEFTKTGFPTDKTMVIPDNTDEFGSMIVRDSKITLDKTTSINVNGTTVEITVTPKEPGVVCVKADKTALKVVDIVSCWNNK